MFKKSLWLRVVLLLVILSTIAVLPAFAADPKKENNVTANFAVSGTGNTEAITLPAAGMGSIALINYDGGGGGPLVVDFNGINYTIPPSTQGQSGVFNHVEISLAPGMYNYTASVAGVGNVTRSVEVVAGKVTSLGFVDNPDQHHTPTSAGALLYFENDMTAQVQ